MLNPDQFYHGTRFHIPDMVRPGDAVDKGPSEYSMGDPGDMSEGDHAFAIRNDERYAWHAAHTFRSNGRRPRVYEVEPAADMKPGPWNKEHPDWLHHVELHDDEYPPSKEDVAEAVKSHHMDEWASPTGFKVKRRIDIMPGRQGTFPEVNWNRFKPNGPYGTDVNHPSDAQIQYGMNLQQGPEAAAKEHAKVLEEREPKRRTSASLREFMGMPSKPKSDPQGHLF